jgi:nucleolar protein 56
MSKDGSCSLILLEVGIAAFDDSGNLVASKKFDDAIRSYRSLKSGLSPEEIRQFIERLRSFDPIFVSDPGLVPALRSFGLEGQVMADERQQEIQNNKPAFLVKSQMASNENDAMQLLRNFAIELSSSRVKEASERLDLHVIQSINALDELDKIINTMGSRLREWYGLHFPELDNLTQSLVAYAEIVRKAGLRQNITSQILQTVGMQEKKTEIILDAAKRSKGGDMTPENLAIARRLADEVVALSDLRRILSDHVESSMEVVAPNTKELLTAAVGARLIAKAGSLTRMATLPASTIQVLGAEKALFRALKTGSRPPKHGLIFQHPLIHSAPKWQRGKIARAVAAKVAIAARIDFYRHSGKDQSIQERLNTRIDEIREKYKEPAPGRERERERERRDSGERRFGGRYEQRHGRDKRHRGSKKDRKKRFGKRRY